MTLVAAPSEAPPGGLSRREALLRETFLEEVERIPGGDRLRRCIQCGTCSGSCPVSYAMDVQPRQLVGLFRAGDLDSIMRSRAIWICASCYSCTVRCPVGIKVTDLIYALKRMALSDEVRSNGRAVAPLSRAFVKIVRRTGRNHELELMARYMLRRAPFRVFSMIPLGWRLWRTGRLAWRPQRIEDVDGLQRIINRAEEMELLYPKDVRRPVEHMGYGGLTERPVAQGGES